MKHKIRVTLDDGQIIIFEIKSLEDSDVEDVLEKVYYMPYFIIGHKLYKNTVTTIEHLESIPGETDIWIGEDDD